MEPTRRAEWRAAMATYVTVHVSELRASRLCCKCRRERVTGWSGDDSKQRGQQPPPPLPPTFICIDPGMRAFAVAWVHSPAVIPEDGA